MNDRLINSSISENESKTIACIRVAATIFIVLCHYFQALNCSELGQIFNVGVPIFFMISGYLYGQKPIKEATAVWYKKQFIKIVVPVYMFYLIMGVILCLIGEQGALNVGQLVIHILNLQGLTDVMLGNIKSAPLWFITYILICYRLTPVLNKLNKKLSLKKQVFAIITLYASEIICILNINARGFMAVGFIGVLLYCAMFFVGANWNKRISVRLYISMTIMMIFAIILRLYVKNLADTNNDFFEILYGRIVAAYTHQVLGVWIFFTVYALCGFMKKLVDFAFPLIKIIDRYSFSIYIVHSTFLDGVFSVMNLTNNLAINTILFCICTFVSAMLLDKISKRIIKLIKKW